MRLALALRVQLPYAALDLPREDSPLLALCVDVAETRLACRNRLAAEARRGADSRRVPAAGMLELARRLSFRR